ncbi:hypothetical protein PH31N_00805 [Cutibacterium modestum 31N]|nr:hypothetical protein [Cutibacterium modestum 31N]
MKSCLARLDDLIDLADVGCTVRVEEPFPVFLDEPLTFRILVGRLTNLATIDQGCGALGPMTAICAVGQARVTSAPIWRDPKAT